MKTFLLSRSLSRILLTAGLLCLALLPQAQAQTLSNVYWNVGGLGGTGTWNTTAGNTVWSTNPAGGGTLIASPNNITTIYNFSGTAGTVTSQSMTVGGINWLTGGYVWTTGANRTMTGDTNTGVSSQIYITNNANLTTIGSGFTFDALTMTGGAGATLTVSNTTLIFGTTGAKGGRTNFVNTIVVGGTNTLGSQAATTGFTQAGNITNNATMLVLTNSASGTVTISGAVSGSGAVTLANSGTGKISLAASNSYAGGTILSNAGTGTFGIGNSAAFGTGTITSAGNGLINFVQADAVGLNVTNNWLLDSGNTLRLGVNTGTNFTASGAMDGSGSVIIGGTAGGTALLSGNNSYSGTTTVTNGATLQLGSATALGNTSGGTTVFSGAALDLNGQAVGAETLSIAGTGVSSGGALLNSSASAASFGGAITLTNDTTVALSAGNITLSGNIGESGGARSMTIAGTNGVVALSGSNSYSGKTSVTNTVTVRVTSVNSLSSNSSLDGASSSARTPTLDLAAPGSYKMNSYSSGNFILLATNGASSLTFTNTGTGNFVQAGSKTITATNVAVTFDGSVDISPTTANKTLSVAGNSDFTFNGAIINTNVSFSAALEVGSMGRTTLNASNNYDGVTTVLAGATLRLANSYALGAANGLTNTVSSGGAIELLGGITIDGENLSLNGTGAGDGGALRNISGNNAYNGPITINSTNRINSDAGTLTIGAFANGLSSSRGLIVGGAGNTVLAGALGGTGTGQLIKDGSGTLTVSAAATMNGGIVVGAGSLIVSSGGSFSNNSATVSISSGGSLIYNGSTPLTSSSVVLGGGAGRAVLGGGGTINSAVALDNINDVLSPGNSPGTLSLTPNQNWSSFTYDWEINNFAGTSPGTDFDTISIAGTLDLSGGSPGSFGLNVLSLTAGNVSGNVPNFSEINTSWTILSASGINGFDAANWSINTNNFSTGTAVLGSFSVSQSGTDLLLTYTVPEPSSIALLVFAGAGLGAWRFAHRRKS